jgi:diguanylate cyclase (GGDEF)-like protein
VIFLTADFEIKDKVNGLDLGAVDYITKPFKSEELRARVCVSIRAKHALDQKAMVDGLAGFWNRNYFEAHLANKMARSRRSGRPVAYIAGDIDDLSKLNAKHGIPFGDEIIRSVGNIILIFFRPEDAVCHFEGGSFAILVSLMGRTGGRVWLIVSAKRISRGSLSSTAMKLA